MPKVQLTVTRANLDVKYADYSLFHYRLVSAQNCLFAVTYLCLTKVSRSTLMCSVLWFT